MATKIIASLLLASTLVQTSSSFPPWKPASPQLLTQWASLVSPTHAHPEHPRPDLRRDGDDSWLSLNGLWGADATPSDLSTPPFGPATTMPQQILVPFPFEASLSGIRALPTHGYMWYRRTVELQLVPARRRTLLKFEAVDWFASVWINGALVGNHSGGYDGFAFDITDHIIHKASSPAATATSSSFELLVGVFDPTEKGNQPHGKQYAEAFHATKATSKYTSTSGIWATVWLEFVPSAAYIDSLHIVTSVAADSASATVTVDPAVVTSAAAATGCDVTVSVLDGKRVVGTRTGAASAGPIAISISPLPKLWSPAAPFLHNLTAVLRCGSTRSSSDENAVVIDTIRSYVGIREVALRALRSKVSRGCAYRNGNELPGYPRASPSAAACEAACVAPACAAWHFAAVPAPPSPPPSPSPPSGPQPGIDLHGGDLPGSPIQLNASDMVSINASEMKCAALCAGHTGEYPCFAWVIDVPGCVAPGHTTFPNGSCWLKRDKGVEKIKNACRISGIMIPKLLPQPQPQCTLHSVVPAAPILMLPGANNASCGYWATKMMLNNAPTPYLAGILSQGFWPDGIYSTPDDLADVFELESEKAMGFNMVRKHIKVAPHRWYYHADRIGFFVWQDMPETIHGDGAGATFMAELEAMVKGRRNHPSIVQWEIFNEVTPPLARVRVAVELVRKFDPTRPIDANSGFRQETWWSTTDVQDFHSDTALPPATNASLLVATSEAHRCGCVPPKQHLWFRHLPLSAACYSVTPGVDCDAASQTFLSWAQNVSDEIKFFGLSATGYVQNRDMEGECNGLLTYDAVQKLNATPIQRGNQLLRDAHAAAWPAAAVAALRT